MEISVTIKTNWPTFMLFAIVSVLVGGVVYMAKNLMQLESTDILLVILALCLLLISLLLYLIQSGTEIAKKTLELEIELEKKKAEDARRKEEERKCDDAEQKKREHEIKLAGIESTIKVEVSNV